ncbi:sugar phosphate isomerase/epimerase family protein [Fodinicola acaciae]|uniref:sugar phosphate isomerase/epimerase family protein n=1 Tax=Fodinicola acaciae TaxID=2681555 RepID=UPI001FE73D47|nr:sugar phosphate isomerase/epimerase [Fodinicola acaciae]
MPMELDEHSVRVPGAAVGLSSVSVYPESTAATFEIASSLGYDGVEIMVLTDPVSQDADALGTLADHYGSPVLAIHAPCLFITQRVWSTDPWERLRRSIDAAERLGAPTVVLHPPFRWQRDYINGFEDGVRRLQETTDVTLAVENMYPLRARGREFSPYAPTWDVTQLAVEKFCLDTSHTAVSRSDPLEMADRMGDGLRHIHLGDGTGLGHDEHMLPGRGNQPCGPLLEKLAGNGFTGAVVVEVSTRSAGSRERRESDLAEALAFARLHLAAPAAARA